MIIGIPKEIKTLEGRISMTPAAVDSLIRRGHTVYIQKNAGIESSFPDEQYLNAGAKLVETAEEVFGLADMIVKVKEPQPQELALLRPNQILFTYLHLAPDPKQAEGLMKSGCVAIAYETITDDHGRIPLLAPMSEVAGRLSIQVGARFLKRHNGGRGILLGGVPGVDAGHVVVLGGGVSV